MGKKINWKINWNLVLLTTIGCYFFSLYNAIQLSEKQFFDSFLDNSTGVDIYNEKTAYLFFNNETYTNHYIHLKNTSTFEDRLEDISYSYPILHKNSYSKSFFDTVFILVLFMMLAQGRGMFSRFTRSIFNEDKVETRLKDVAGLDHQKEEVFEFVDFLKNREKYIEIGARMPRGALFYGPPGTGKTLLAKAVAGECGCSFLSVAGPTFSEMFVGVGAARVRDLFEKARKKAPCIIFIDEIDALAKSRNNPITSGHHEKENTLNQFLIELDGFQENDKILIFGATNRFDMLDKALLRPGRFDRKIRFELPERGDREKIFQLYLSKMKIEGEVSELSNILSKQSFGFSCADIANICNEASILSVRLQKEKVSLKILEMAVDNILLGPQKKTFRLSDKERKIVAYHESGHSLMSYILPHATPPIKVSIMPRGKSALGFSQTEVSETKLNDRDELLDKICVLFGGRVAEEIFFDNATTGAADDIQKSTEIAYQFVTTFGLDEAMVPFHYNRKNEYYSQSLREKIDQIVQRILTNSYKKTHKILRNHKGLLEKMAQALLEKETLNQIEIKELFGTIPTLS